MILYLDTSVMVKLYMEEEDSSQIASLVDSVGVVAASIIAYVEARSAFARRYREKSIDPETYKNLLSIFNVDWGRYLQIAINAPTVRQAGDLAEKHALKGYDALHLSAAMTLRKATGAPVLFLTADEALQRAAKKELFYLSIDRETENGGKT
jgi:uncharacterized protein